MMRVNMGSYEKEEVIVNGEYTLEMWALFPTTLSTTQTIAEKEDHFKLLVNPSPSLSLLFYGSKSSTNINGNLHEELSNIPSNVWTHLAVANSAQYNKALLLTDTAGGEIEGWDLGQSSMRSLLAIGGPIHMQHIDDHHHDHHAAHFIGKLFEVRLWTAYRGLGNIHRDRYLTLQIHSFQLARKWKPLLTQTSIYIYIYAFINLSLLILLIIYRKKISRGISCYMSGGAAI